MEDNKWSPLMEQNWKRMQIILDQELPVQSDKRRNILAFCFFGGIIFGVIGLLFYFSNFNIKLNSKQNNQNSTFAVNKTINVSDSDCADIKNAIVVNNNIFTTKKSGLTGKQKAIKSDGSNSTGNELQILNNKISHEFPQNIETTSLNTDVLDVGSTEPIVLLKPLPGLQSQTVDMLSPKLFWLKSEKNINILSSPIETSPVIANNGWHYGIKTDLSFNTFAPPNQYYAGLFLNKSIGKIFIVEAQLGTRYYSRYTSFLNQGNSTGSSSNDLLESADAASVNIFNLDSKILTNNTIAYANESIINSTMRSAQYLESSLSLGVKLNKKIILKSGFSVGRFLNAEYNINEESKSIFKALGNTQKFENINQNLANTLLKKWLMVGFLETDYQFLSRWTLTSAISIGRMNAVLDNYEFSSNVSPNGSTQNTSITFSQPEKGTINVSLGLKYNLY